MNACNAACGYCGRCTAPLGRWRADVDREPPSQFASCDVCGDSFLRGGFTVGGIGTFCSERCKTHGVQIHEQRAADAVRRTA